MKKKISNFYTLSFALILATCIIGYAPLGGADLAENEGAPPVLTAAVGDPISPTARGNASLLEPSTGATSSAGPTGQGIDRVSPKKILINFNNVGILEFIRFISKISNINFVFDEQDLQFNVTIVSEEPTTIENIMAALLQELRIHDLTMMEQGNNIIIHRNLNVNGISKVVSEDLPQSAQASRAEIVTRLFRLNIADADKIAAIIKPLVSSRAIVEVFKETNHIIVTDIVTNIQQIADLIRALDAPNNGLVIGQYVVRGGFIDSLIQLAQKIMLPISTDKILIFVPHRAANSIFLVSTPFLMERTIAILQYLDQNQGVTRIFDLKDLKFIPGAEGRLRVLPGGIPPGQFPAGKWEMDGQGNWIYKLTPQQGVSSGSLPQGYWTIDDQGNWRFNTGTPPPAEPGSPSMPVGPPGFWTVDEDGHWTFVMGTPPPSPQGVKGLIWPEGKWVLDPQGIWIFQLAPGRSISPERLERVAGQWELDPQGNWIYRPFLPQGLQPGTQPPQGYWTVDENGNWRFQVGTAPPTPGGAQGLAGPEGQWVLDSQGVWVFQLASGKSISPERLGRAARGTADLPLGHIARTQFFIYKLKYRKGEQIQIALGRIGQSLRVAGTNNVDLIDAIDSVQWLEASNSLLFTGTVESLDKIQELISDIDTPLRQVFIECLILETTIDDSLLYSVNWGTQFGGGDFSGSQAFLSPGSPLEAALATAVPGSTPSAALLAQSPGFSTGIVGDTLTHGGLQFNSLGALVKALRNNTDVDVVMSPKILTEDNVPAEIFVGINTRFPTQAVVNNLGVIVTQNFEFRDVGTLLKVTPLIGSNDVITLIIQEQVSRTITSDANVGETGLTTSISRTSTRVHLPNECFLVISGMMADEDTVIDGHVPCLGSIPFIGAAFKDIRIQDSKRNTMLFLRPKIVDTEEEMDKLTKHEQDIYRYKKRQKQSWKYETDEALDFFSLPRPDSCDLDNWDPETPPYH